MDNLKVSEESIQRTKFPDDLDVIDILKIADNLSYKKELKEIQEYNAQLDNSNYTEETFISTFFLIESIYKKALENGDSFQIWKKVEYKKDIFDNVCLAGNKVYEVPKPEHTFCNLGASDVNGNMVTDIKECFFDGLMYDPTNNRNEWYLTTPDYFFSDLYIEVNGKELKLTELDNFSKSYLSNDYERKDKNEVLKMFVEAIENNDFNELNNLKSNYGFIPNTFYSISIKENLDFINENLNQHDILETIKRILKGESDYYLDQDLYHIYEKNGKVIFISEDDILENFDGFTTLIKGLEKELRREIPDIYFEKLEVNKDIRNILPDNLFSKSISKNKPLKRKI